jgi:hypothetical protein
VFGGNVAEVIPERGEQASKYAKRIRNTIKQILFDSKFGDKEHDDDGDDNDDFFFLRFSMMYGIV